MRRRSCGSSTNAEPHATDLEASAREALQAEAERDGHPAAAEAARRRRARPSPTAAVQVDAEYPVPVEHHNPMELFATTVVWDDDGKLTVYDKTQGVQNVQRLPLQRVRLLEGRRARRLAVRRRGVRLGAAPAVPGLPGRPGGAGAEALGPGDADAPADVQLRAPPRRPGSAWRSARRADGTLEAVIHEAVAETSRFEDYTETVVNWSGLLYRCDNVKLDHKVVAARPAHADRHAGAGRRLGRVRARMRDGRARRQARHRPGRAAAEELRRAATRTSGKPFSSKELRACYRAGRRAVRLGAAQPEPALDARGRDADRLGHGRRRLGGRCRTTAAAKAVLDRRRQAHRQQRHGRHRHRHLHGHDPDRRRDARPADRGRDVQARRLVPAEGAGRGRVVHGRLGRLGGQGRLRGGAREAVRARAEGRRLAARRRRARRRDVRRRADPAERRPVAGRLASPRRCGTAKRRRHRGGGVRRPAREAGAATRATRTRRSSPRCEVDEDLGTVRVTRVVSAVAGGRILNPKTARSQVLGGIVWGIGMALEEESVIDHAVRPVHEPQPRRVPRPGQRRRRTTSR